MQKNNIEAVDLVYLWVDDKDENWIKKRDSFLNPELKSEAVSCCRFRDNDELKMSLRSVEKHLPWINKIFVVTDGQIPRWLDTENPKIEVVFHEQFIPQEYLPTFNSNVAFFLGSVFLFKKVIPCIGTICTYSFLPFETFTSSKILSSDRTSSISYCANT